MDYQYTYETFHGSCQNPLPQPRPFPTSRLNVWPLKSINIRTRLVIIYEFRVNTPLNRHKQPAADVETSQMA